MNFGGKIATHSHSQAIINFRQNLYNVGYFVSNNIVIYLNKIIYCIDIYFAVIKTRTSSPIGRDDE